MSSSDNHLFSDHAPLVLASRVSPLACIQAEEVKARLAPITASIATFSTRGDEGERFFDVTLLKG